MIIEMRAVCMAAALCVVMTAPVSAKLNEFDNYTYMFCLKVGELQDPPAWNTKKKFLEPMEEAAASIGRKAEDILLNPYCEPRYIGATLAPILHLMAENTTDRLAFLVEIRKYFLEKRQRPDIWRAMVNSKNTRGMTVLDYIEYNILQRKLIVPEAEGVSAFVGFICAEGGTYAVLKKRCAKTQEDTPEGIRLRLNATDKARNAEADALIRSQPDARKPEDR